MPVNFTVKKTSGDARLGCMVTPHGVVQTPVFMPVGTAASVKAVPQSLLEELGAEIVLANTYHLYLRPGHDLIRQLGGLHRFMSWDRALLTDSGGYQVFSLNELRKVTEEGVRFRSHLDGSSHFFSPEHSIDVQVALGADIIMCFDECVEYPAEKNRVRESMELTLRWAQRCKTHFEARKHQVPWVPPPQPSGEERTGLGSNERDATSAAAPPEATESEQTQLLFGIVQGGMHEDLRRESALRTVEMDFPGYAIGGLSVGEPRRCTREMIAAALEHLPADKPRYVMGVGYPEEIVEYAAMGVEMMDCVLPTRAARHGLLFTSEGRINIKGRRYADDSGPLDPNCRCPVCRRYSRAYLRHLVVSGEPLAGVLNTLHNLAYYLDTMAAVRHAIKLGELSGLLARVRYMGSHQGV